MVRFLSDFKLGSHHRFSDREYYKSVVKSINEKNIISSGLPQIAKSVRFDLDLVGFIEFLLQLGMFKYGIEYHHDPIASVGKLFEDIRTNNQTLNGMET